MQYGMIRINAKHIKIMPKITVINADMIQSELTYEAGQNLMELLRDADFDEIAALCGGNCSCATCHVHIDPQQLDATQFDPPNEIELELLDLDDNYIP